MRTALKKTILPLTVVMYIGCGGTSGTVMTSKDWQMINFGTASYTTMHLFMQRLLISLSDYSDSNQSLVRQECGISGSVEYAYSPNVFPVTVSFQNCMQQTQTAARNGWLYTKNGVVIIDGSEQNAAFTFSTDLTNIVTATDPTLSTTLTVKQGSELLISEDDVFQSERVHYNHTSNVQLDLNGSLFTTSNAKLAIGFNNDGGSILNKQGNIVLENGQRFNLAMSESASPSLRAYMHYVMLDPDKEFISGSLLYTNHSGTPFPLYVERHNKFSISTYSTDDITPFLWE